MQPEQQLPEVTSNEFIELFCSSERELAKHREINASNAAAIAIALREKDDSFVADFSNQFFDASKKNGTESFYQRLYDLLYFLGVSDKEASQFASAAWGYFCQHLNDEDLEKHFNDLLSVQGFHFFLILRLLPIHSSLHRIKAKFASQWFPALQDKAGNDMAISPLFVAIENWAIGNPEESILAIQLLLKEDGEDHLDVAARMLGSIRGKAPNIAEELSKQLEISELENERKCFLRSWLTTNHSSPIDDKTLGTILDQVSLDTPRETKEGIKLARTKLLDDLDSDAIDQILDWLLGIPKDKIDDHDRFLVCGAVSNTLKNNQKELDSSRLEKIGLLLSTIQPIPTEQQGSWRHVVEVVEHIAEINDEAFRSVIRAIFDANPAAIDGLYPDSKDRRQVSPTLAKASGPIIETLMFSPDRQDRVFACRLTRAIGINEVTFSSSKHPGVEALGLAILQPWLSISESNLRMRILLKLLPLVESAKELHQLYSDEVFYEARNLSGENQPLLEDLKSKSKLIRSILTRVKRHFRASIKTNKSPIRSIHVPGHQAAYRYQMRKRGQAVAKGIHQESSFLQFCQTVSFVYGQQGFKMFNNDQLGGITEFQSHSHEMAWPSLDMADNDGQVVRRLQGRQLQDELANQIKSKPDPK